MAIVANAARPPMFLHGGTGRRGGGGGGGGGEFGGKFDSLKCVQSPTEIINVIVYIYIYICIFAQFAPNNLSKHKNEVAKCFTTSVS